MSELAYNVEERNMQPDYKMMAAARLVGTSLYIDKRFETSFDVLARDYIENFIIPDIKKNGTFNKSISEYSSLERIIIRKICFIASEYGICCKISYTPDDCIFYFWYENND